MFYRIPAAHVETFESFYERLTTQEEFQSLPASTDPDAPDAAPSTEIYSGDVNYEFMPQHLDSVLRDDVHHRMVLLSRCKTMLISYRLVFGRFEATLYRDTAAQIEALYRAFRSRAVRHHRPYERTGMTTW